MPWCSGQGVTCLAAPPSLSSEGRWVIGAACSACRLTGTLLIFIENCIPLGGRSHMRGHSLRPALTARLCPVLFLAACAPLMWASALISSHLITAQSTSLCVQAARGRRLAGAPGASLSRLLQDVAYMDATKVLLDRFDASHPVIPGSAALGTDYEELEALLREEAKRHMLARSRVRNAQVTAAARAVRDALALYQRHPTLAYAREGLMHAAVCGVPALAARQGSRRRRPAIRLYAAFWERLAPRLLAVLNAAFHSASTTALPLSMRSGRITLLYKGKGADRTQPSSYRPITLLNCDYKIAAAAIAARLGAPLSSVVDSSQTAFLPKRWIGDNVLVHLETLDYLQATGQPGAMVFVDLAKAFDRIDRAWILRSLEALGAPACIPRWVEVLHGGTCATVAYNGWVTAPFPVRSGVFQGSPLSPVLYVAASQPLAAYTRSLAAQGLIRPILLPSGRPAPLLHQHADDTTVHVRTRADARLVIDGPIQMFCRASGSLVQPSKSQGLEVCAPEGGHPFFWHMPPHWDPFCRGHRPYPAFGGVAGA